MDLARRSSASNTHALVARARVTNLATITQATGIMGWANQINLLHLSGSLGGSCVRNSASFLSHGAEQLPR